MDDRIRTGDRLDHNQELYQLSYVHRAALQSSGLRRVRRRRGSRGSCVAQVGFELFGLGGQQAGGAEADRPARLHDHLGALPARPRPWPRRPRDGRGRPRRCRSGRPGARSSPRRRGSARPRAGRRRRRASAGPSPRGRARRSAGRWGRRRRIEAKPISGLSPGLTSAPRARARSCAPRQIPSTGICRSTASASQSRSAASAGMRLEVVDAHRAAHRDDAVDLLVGGQRVARQRFDLEHLDPLCRRRRGSGAAAPRTRV